MKLLFLIFFLFSFRALASLGDREDSIQRDSAAMKGVRRNATTPAGKNFTVREIQNGGNTIKEFLSPQGVIFAVSWRGLSHPDLSILLGSYFNEYKNSRAALQKKKGRSAKIQVQSNNIVVEHSGHMRDVRGRAYIPNLIPNNVSVEDLQ